MMMGAPLDRQVFCLGAYQKRVSERLDAWQATHFARRLWAKDPTLWFSHPVAEIVDRLGWLTAHETGREQLDDLLAFAARMKAEGVRHVVLLGMGGSSLAPEIFQRTFGNESGHPELIVLDSTHPAAVRAVEDRIALRHTLFLVSSKSGTTLEVLSFFRTFWERLKRDGADPGRHFVAITDPGTPLEQLARERSFRRVFLAPADVGGRYSALTVFGLVPAALIGMDVGKLIDRARTLAEACSFGVPAPANPALRLGAALGELARAGRDKLTFVPSPRLSAFPVWLEQLIAESTGKDGKGLLPVADEPIGRPELYGTDRVFVGLFLGRDEQPDLTAALDALETRGHPVARIRLAETADLGQEIFRWEMAVAAAGAVLGIHPFDQPDVQLAKDLAREAMAKRGQGPERPAASEDVTCSVARSSALREALQHWLAQARAGDYVTVQAYLAPAPDTTDALQRIRLMLRDRLKLATTLGYGPRFLHSTGQLHKGGPNTGLFLQIVDEPGEDLPVPETDYTFGALIRAQAWGDFQALVQRGRRVVRIQVGADVGEGLARVAESLR